MTAHRVQLDIPNAMVAYAMIHGARKDNNGQWFANEPLANELESFRIKVVRQREYEFEPICPKSGHSMVKRTNLKNGNQFWGCSAFPACRKTMEIAYPVADNIADLALKSMQQALSSPRPSEEPHGLPPRQTVGKDYLKRRWVQILEKAAASLGGVKQAQRWLETPHPNLQHKRPIYLLGTPSGCNAVEQILCQRQQ